MADRLTLEERAAVSSLLSGGPGLEGLRKLLEGEAQEWMQRTLNRALASGGEALTQIRDIAESAGRVATLQGLEKTLRNALRREGER